MIRRLWEGALRGGYPGHGETFLNPENILWWSHGGELHGESWKRIGFLLDILQAVPANGLHLAEKNMADWDCVHVIPSTAAKAAESSYHLLLLQLYASCIQRILSAGRSGVES